MHAHASEKRSEEKRGDMCHAPGVCFKLIETFAQVSLQLYCPLGQSNKMIKLIWRQPFHPKYAWKERLFVIMMSAILLCVLYVMCVRVLWCVRCVRCVRYVLYALCVECIASCTACSVWTVCTECTGCIVCTVCFVCAVCVPSGGSIQHMWGSTGVKGKQQL